MTEQYPINLKVNGENVSLNVSPFTSLAQLLRENLGLTGTKISCNEGECGSCTVIMDEQIVNSCLVLAPQADGSEVWTIEGLTPKDGLHPMQEAFLQEGAVQCGYCTPGFIMSAVALLRENPDPTDEEIIEAISGNLCRCTGYHKIVAAIRSCAQTIREAEMSV